MSSLKFLLLTILVVIPPFSTSFDIISRNDFQDSDTFWHLACGRLIMSLGYVPAVDSFSFNTNSTEWVNINWLSQILLYLSFSYFGYFGPSYLSYVCLGVFTIFFFRFCAKESSDPILSSLLYSVIINFFWAFNLVRPQTFSLLMFSLISYFYLWKAESNILSKKNLVFLTLILTFWGNLHGGIIVGYFVLTFNVIGSILNNYVYKNNLKIPQRQMQYCYAMLISLVLFYFHPLGYKALFYIINYSENLDKLYYENIKELMPLALDFSLGKYVIIPVVIPVFIAIKNKLDINYEIALTALALLIISLHAVRFLPFFYIYTFPFIVKICSEYLHGSNVKGKVYFKNLNYIILFAVSFCILILPFCLDTFNSTASAKRFFDDKIFPVNAINYFSLIGNKEVNVLAEYNFSGYVIWKASEKVKVFIDGRGDLHSGIPTYKDYRDIIKMKKGWRNILSGYKVDYLFMKKDEPVIDQLGRDGWELVHTDDYFSIIKNPNSNQ